MLEAIRQLLPILAGLYLLEGVTWVRGSRVLYVTPLVGQVRRLRSGLHLTGIFPPREAFALHGTGALDLDALRQRHGPWRDWSRSTANLALLYLFWVFGGLGLLLVYPSPSPIPEIFLGLCLLLHFATATAAHRLARRLDDEGLPTPSAALVGIWMYPPATMRAVAGLSRELLTGFDDLALAAAFLEREDLRHLARRELAMARAATERDGNDERFRALRKLLRQAGSSPERVLQAPDRQDTTARAYCPACTAEYVKTDILCNDCEVPLEPYRL